MHRSAGCTLLLFLACALSAISARAQAISVPVTPPVLLSSWEVAQQIGSSKHRILVVTLDQPERKQACRVQSLTKDELVCSRPLGNPRTYRPEEVLALIVPGDEALRIRVLLGLNGGMGAAIWGTVVLAAACPACAVGTGVVALVLFGAAGAIAYGDGQEEQSFYVAPGHELKGKLSSIHAMGPP